MDGMAQFHILLENCLIMGTDNLFHKRKARQKSLQRKQATREQYPRILVLCEGEKTEVFYIKDFCKVFMPKRVVVEIRKCSQGNTPRKIVEYAIQQKEEDFDKVYCVFDKDEHPCFYDAIKACDGENIIAIPSVPCFEYWFVLHFEETTRPYAKTGQYTIGEKVKKHIRKYITSYREGAKGIFFKTKNNLEIAIKRAKDVEKQNKENGTDNPSTKVYQLIEDLLALAEKYQDKK
jgi:hypothetical protein